MMNGKERAMKNRERNKVEAESLRHRTEAAADQNIHHGTDKTH